MADAEQIVPTQEEREIVAGYIYDAGYMNGAYAIRQGEVDKQYQEDFAKLRAYRANAETEIRGEIAAWYQREGYLLDEDDVPAAIRAGSATIGAPVVL